MLSYIDELKQFEYLVKQVSGVNENLLCKAEKLIKSSEDLQKEAYYLIAEAYQSASNHDLELDDSIHGQFDFLNYFDEFAEEEKEQIKNREKEQEKISALEPSGFTDTDKTLHDYAGEVVKYAKSVFNDEQFTAHVWPYRWGGYNVVSCDLFKEEKGIAVNIHAAERQRFIPYLNAPEVNVLEIEVFDMAEALHLVGIVTQALNVNILIGLGHNEVNPAVLSSLLKTGETFTENRRNQW